MKGGTHQLTFALLARVDVHLHRLGNFVVFGEVFGFGHAKTVGLENSGRQQPNAAKAGRNIGIVQMATQSETVGIVRLPR